MYPRHQGPPRATCARAPRPSARHPASRRSVPAPPRLGAVADCAWTGARVRPGAPSSRYSRRRRGAPGGAGGAGRGGACQGRHRPGVTAQVRVRPCASSARALGRTSGCNFSRRPHLEPRPKERRPSGWSEAGTRAGGSGALGGRVEGAMARGPGRPCALLLLLVVSAVGRGGCGDPDPGCGKSVGRAGGRGAGTCRLGSAFPFATLGTRRPWLTVIGECSEPGRGTPGLGTRALFEVFPDWVLEDRRDRYWGLLPSSRKSPTIPRLSSHRRLAGGTRNKPVFLECKTRAKSIFFKTCDLQSFLFAFDEAALLL